MLIVCYCCNEIIKDEKEFYLVSVKSAEIVEEQICRKTGPWLLEEMRICSLRCIIVELAKRMKQ